MTIRSILLFCLLPLWTLALHSVFSRLAGKNKDRLRFAIMCGVATTALSITFILWVEAPRNILSFLAFCLFNGIFLTQIYFQFFLMGETARRIRILTDLVTLGTAPLVSPYTPRYAIRLRVDRLRHLKQIYETNGVFKARTTPLVLIAKLFKKYQQILFPVSRVTN